MAIFSILVLIRSTSSSTAEFQFQDSIMQVPRMYEITQLYPGCTESERTTNQDWFHKELINIHSVNFIQPYRKCDLQAHRDEPKVAKFQHESFNKQICIRQNFVHDGHSNGCGCRFWVPVLIVILIGYSKPVLRYFEEPKRHLDVGPDF